MTSDPWILLTYAVCKAILETVSHQLGAPKNDPFLSVSFTLFALSAADPEPVGCVLIYQVPDDAPVTIQGLAGAIEQRVNPNGQKRGEVSFANDSRQIKVGVYGSEPQEAEQVRKDIGIDGRLEFRILANEKDHADIIKRAKSLDGSTKVLRGADGTIAARWVAMNQNLSVQQGIEVITRPFGANQLEGLVVIDSNKVDGRYITRVSAGVDGRGRPTVNFKLNAEGARRLAVLTGANVPDLATGFHRRIGIILDGSLASAPMLNESILDSVELSGAFTQDGVNAVVHRFQTMRLIGEDWIDPAK